MTKKDLEIWITKFMGKSISDSIFKKMEEMNLEVVQRERLNEEASKKFNADNYCLCEDGGNPFNGICRKCNKPYFT
jgi:hypothetical protein